MIKILLVILTLSLSISAFAADPEYLGFSDVTIWNKSDASNWRQAFEYDQSAITLDTTFTSDLPERADGSTDYPDGDYYWLSIGYTLHWYFEENTNITIETYWGFTNTFAESHRLSIEIINVAGSYSDDITAALLVRFPRTFDNTQVYLFVMAFGGGQYTGVVTKGLINLQPLPSTSTPTNTPTITPTFTPTATPTFTPTHTPTVTPTTTVTGTVRPYDVRGDVAYAKHSAPGIFENVNNNDSFIADGFLTIAGRCTNFGRDLAGSEDTRITIGVTGPYPSTAWIKSSSAVRTDDLPYYWSWMYYYPTNVDITNWETGYYRIRAEAEAIGFTDSDTSNNYSEILFHLTKPTPTNTPTSTPTPTPTITQTPTPTPTAWAWFAYCTDTGVPKQFIPLVEEARKNPSLSYLFVGKLNEIELFMPFMYSAAPPGGKFVLKKTEPYWWYALSEYHNEFQ